MAASAYYEKMKGYTFATPYKKAVSDPAAKTSKSTLRKSMRDFGRYRASKVGNWQEVLVQGKLARTRKLQWLSQGSPDKHSLN